MVDPVVESDVVAVGDSGVVDWTYVTENSWDCERGNTGPMEKPTDHR
jgi:hypothetical protein